MVETTVSEQVIEAVAGATGTDALELPPLYDAIDPDALNTLVEGSGGVTISFVYAGQEVCIESDGAIRIGECADPPVGGEVPADD